eukprot:12468716-Ditylum_brightwellii.AAC.1
MSVMHSVSKDAFVFVDSSTPDSQQTEKMVLPSATIIDSQDAIDHVSIACGYHEVHKFFLTLSPGK